MSGKQASCLVLILICHGNRCLNWLKESYVLETGVLVGFDNYLSGKQCPYWLKESYALETGVLIRFDSYISGKQVS